MRRLLLLAVAFILYGSLYPFAFDFGRVAPHPLAILLHSWPARIDRFAWRDASVNVLLYFPLGLAAAMVLPRRWPRVLAALVTIASGTALSASIEMLQIFDSSRTCSLLDVLCNFTGTAVGVCAALLFRPKLLAIGERRGGDRGATGALLLAACWAGYQLYPFIPILSTWRLRANLARLLAARISPVEICAGAAEWFAFALILRAVAGRLKGPWLWLAMLCLPLRLLILERALAPGEVLGAALALLVWTYPAEGTRVRAAAGTLAAALLLRELAPFRFTPLPHPMSWLPFAAAFDAERLSAALVMLRKSFDYGALVWLLRASGLRYGAAGACVASSLLLAELAQCYLPGRQPEITDAVLAAILAGVLWGMERRSTAAAAPRPEIPAPPGSPPSSPPPPRPPGTPDMFR